MNTHPRGGGGGEKKKKKLCSKHYYITIFSVYVSIIIYYYVYQSESWCFVRETCAGVVTGDGGAGRDTSCPPPSRNIYCRGELSVPAMVLEHNNDARGQGKTRLPACNRLAKKKQEKPNANRILRFSRISFFNYKIISPSSRVCRTQLKTRNNWSRFQSCLLAAIQIRHDYYTYTLCREQQPHTVTTLR